MALTVELLNKAQVAIAQGTSLQDFKKTHSVSDADAAEFDQYWSKLSDELKTPLKPGHYWDVSPEWG